MSRSASKRVPSDEPHGLLANQLAPHLIYEDMNQEYPTSIFFDGDRDMSNNGLPVTYPNGDPRMPGEGSPNVIEVNQDCFIDLDTWSIKSPSWTPTGDYIYIGHTSGESVEYWISIDYRWGSFGGGTLTKLHYDMYDEYVKVKENPAKVYGFSKKDENNVWHYYVSYSSGYYLKSLSERRLETQTVYMQSYEGDVDIGSGVNRQMLGIQYWFYYPYHDDPGNPLAGHPTPHQHDWWYVWIVYDEVDHKPYQVIYDFHHNVRVLPWDDARVHKEDGFHTIVWVDAGGHRSLYAEGEDITVQQGYNIMQSIDKTHPEYAFQSDNTPWGDELFGLMVDGLENYPVRAFIGYNFISVEAEWRKFSVTLESVDVTAGTAWWWVGAIIEDSVSLTFRNVDGEYSDNGGAYLCVEDFKTVYVWDTSDTKKLDTLNTEIEEDKHISGQESVKVGYTGDNIYSNSESGSDWWPTFYLGVEKTYLPWMETDTSNTVYEAWIWKDSSATSESPTRGWEWNYRGIS